MARRGLQAAGLVALVAAVAWPRPLVPTRAASLDVIVVLDVSRSMRVADVAPDRLSAAHREVLDVVEADAARRVAVIAFGDAARVVCPLTSDLEAVREALTHAGDDVAPGGSRMADALDRAAGMASTESLVLVVSDGEPGPASEGDPSAAAARLRATGSRLVVVGVGTVDGGPVPGSADPATGAAPHHSRLAVARLRDVADAGGGRFLQAGSGSVIDTSDDVPAPRRALDNPAAVVALVLLLADAVLWWLAAETNPWT